MFNGCKSLKMKESENRVFRFPCSDNSWTELFRVPLIRTIGSHHLAGSRPNLSGELVCRVEEIKAW